MSLLELKIILVRQKLIDLESLIYDEFKDEGQAEELFDMLEFTESTFEDFVDKAKEFKENCHED